MTVITVGAADDTPQRAPISKRTIVLFAVGVLVSLCVGAVLFWKLWYCPGALGRFDSFLCKCVPGSSKTQGKRRCSCDEFFEEKRGSCQACGGLGQACCSEGPPCQYTPDVAYLCRDGVCGPKGPFG